jgi:hypothetical protein
MKSRPRKGRARRLRPGELHRLVMGELERRVELAHRPATDEQLARIWPPWNALPADMLPEERTSILTGATLKRHPERHEHFKRLQTLFGCLPLDPNENCQALNIAERWSQLVEFHRNITSRHADWVQTQWIFRDADTQIEERLAIVRAAKELAVTHPDLLACPTPTKADCVLLDARFSAYAQARQKALKALTALLYKVPGIRTGKPLPVDERAVGLPHPPDDVPHYLYIARLDALGICSPARFAKFITEDLVKLDRDRRRAFYAMSLRPRHGKEPNAAFLVWVLDNLPVFEHPQFAWHWRHILSAAGKLGISHPAQKNVKQWASDNHAASRLRRGASPCDSSGITQSRDLLSPAPVFGEVLKSSSA